MDGLANKIKLDSKTSMIMVTGVVMVLVGIVLYFMTSSQSPTPQSPSQQVVTKNEDKTYQRYVALKEERPASESAATESPTGSVSPTATRTPTPTPTKKVQPQTTVTTTPEPTEIVIAGSPTVTPESTSPTSEPTEVATLPTTGNIQGGVLIFLVSISMIAFAFVL